MSYSAKQLEELEQVIAGGVSSAAEQDRRVNYRTLEELRSLRDEMRRHLEAPTAARRVKQAVYEKGL